MEKVGIDLLYGNDYELEREIAETNKQALAFRASQWTGHRREQSTRHELASAWVKARNDELW